MFKIFVPGRDGVEECIAEFNSLDNAMKALAYWRYNINQHAVLREEV